MSGPPLPAAVAALLRRLESGAREVLGAQFVGLYLYGSLAAGDFNPATSDVDFLVVVAGDLEAATVDRLRQLHARLWNDGGGWAAKLEGCYLPQKALRRHDPEDPPRPCVNEGRFYLAPLGPDWIIQRHTLRTHPRALSGPPLAPLIAPLTPDDIRGAVADLLRGWWAGLLAHPERLRGGDYQAYAILTMCRALAALESGVVLSKPAAAARVGERRPALAPLIDAALAWRPGAALDRLDDVLALVGMVVALAEETGR